jgi:hypothetical protein
MAQLLLSIGPRLQDGGNDLLLPGNLRSYPYGMSLFRKRVAIATPETALSGREEAMAGLVRHLVLGTRLTPPFPDGTERAIFGMGCFWGADRPLGFVSQPAT